MDLKITVKEIVEKLQLTTYHDGQCGVSLLYERFISRNSNVDKRTKRKTCPMGFGTPERRLEPTDETSYQIFRNTIRKKKGIPKNKQKIMVQRAFSIKGEISCHSFRTIMDGLLYVEILWKHLLSGAKKQFGDISKITIRNTPVE